MDEMVSYIFRSMRSSELTLRGVKRVLKNQARRNRNFKRFAWLTVGYLVISEINRSLMEKKIKELDEEIKKLKQEKWPDRDLSQVYHQKELRPYDSRGRFLCYLDRGTWFVVYGRTGCFAADRSGT